MNSLPLLQLPSEIRSQVFSYCRKKDLHNLSFCCRLCCADVAPFLWSKVIIPWEKLDNDVDRKEIINLKYATEIQFCRTIESVEPQPLVRSRGFELILQCMNPRILKSLTIDRYIVPDALQLLSTTFLWLESLSINHPHTDHNYAPALSWSCIMLYTQMKQLLTLILTL